MKKKNLTKSIALTAVLINLCFLPLIVKHLYNDEEWIYYFGVPKKYGNYHYIGKLLKEKKHIDIAFIGSSNFQTSVIPDRIENKLYPVINVPLVIENLSTSWYGTESVYLRVLDVQKHLTPKIIFTDEAESLNWPHELSRYMARSDLASVEDLSFKERVTLYTISVLAAPRQVWFFIKYKRNEILMTKEAEKVVLQYDKNRGFVREELGWLSHYDKNRNNRQPFIDIDDENFKLQNLSNKCWTNGNQENIKRELGWTYTAYQTAFLNEISLSSKNNKVLFKVIAMPTHFKGDEFREFYVERLSRIAFLRQVDN